VLGLLALYRLTAQKAHLIENQKEIVHAITAGNLRKTGAILGPAFVGWALCAAVIGIGMSVTSLWNALVIHAIGAPVIFVLLSVLYFRKFNYSTP
jgi:hypothetical protein